MTTLLEDVRYAFRTLRKSPAFTFTAVLTIALGIGACTAIFSVVNAVLLRYLPYEQPERLAFVQSDLTARGVNDYPMAAGDLPDLRAGITAFQDAASVITNNTVYTSDAGDPEYVVNANVTTNFFRTMGARFMLGRDFVDEDGTPLPPPPQGGPGAQPQPGAAPPPPPPPFITVISHGFWQRRFGGDPDVIGQTFRLGQATGEIVGVLAPEFELLWPKASLINPRPDIYLASRQDFATAARGSVSLRVVGRLKPGATIAQAQEQANRVVADLRSRFPNKEAAGLRWRIEPMHSYAVARVRPLLLALMGAVVFVLLIACSNVANLLLVRGSQRERELTVRAALGSGRWALMRQTLVESLVLSSWGAALGLGLAWAGTRALIRFGPEDLPRLDTVGLDGAVFGFTLLATVLSGLAFGLIPALRASRVNVADTLRSSGRSGALAGLGKWLRQGVVVSEVALAFVLLLGCGLMIRSFVTLNRAQPGFDSNGVLTFQVPNQNFGVQSFEEAIARGRQIQQRLAGIPGVTAVSAASGLPMGGSPGSVPWGTEAALSSPDLFQQADARSVRDGYFETMKTRVIEGRTFTEADAAPNRNVIVIDEVLAKMAFPSGSAVGQRLWSRPGGQENIPFEVIGVVQHQRNLTPAQDSRQTWYTPGFASNQWVVRTTGSNPMSILATVRNEMRQVNASILVANPRPLHELVDDAGAETRFALWCIGVFAIIALTLASIGLYGVLSTTVSMRTAEIGMRMALGASTRNIFRLIARQGAMLSGMGIFAGIVIAFWLSRLMTTMLVGVSPTDPMTFLTTGALFLGIALVACSVPALRASRLAPVVALRED
jgi:putative ABC transport system permease protein